METDTVRVLLHDIREMRKKLDEMERELLRLIIESEEPEIIDDELYAELLRKAKEPKKKPEKGLTLEEALQQLTE
ncbi:hypothetical protein [Thermococcus thermotolerans]|uniref:hypothetical protein n=1 Tax=Thermococcus thermotolerans TaxID=2969672 RepID=UPI002157F9DF|nr:hypothetical protein [Thermococcus thermotolerans]